MSAEERALTIPCRGAALLGIVNRPPEPSARGVVVVVGGPQYRAGSHRQFVLLARHLAAAGVPVLRFDYRGMGDSDGEPRTFEDVDADIGCAIDAFFESLPGLKEVAIWGLCDAASAALFYAHRDARVSGLVLLNPWVHTEQGAARAYLRHYYIERLFQASLWGKIARGEFSVRAALAGLRDLLRSAGRGPADASGAAHAGQPAAPAPPLPERMADSLARFRGRVLLILSGRDIVAQEFTDLVAGSREWRTLLSHARVARRELADANHTFARRDWRDQVAGWTAQWVKSW